MTAGNLTAGNLSAGHLTAGNLSVDKLTIDNLTVGNLSVENLTAVNHKNLLIKDGNVEISGQAAKIVTTGFPVINNPQVVSVPTAGLQTGLQVNNLQTGVQSVPGLNMAGFQTYSDQRAGLKVLDTQPVTRNIDTEVNAIQGVQNTGIQYPVGFHSVSLHTSGIQPSFPTRLSTAVMPVSFQQTGLQVVAQTADLPQTVLQTAGLPLTILQTAGLPYTVLQTDGLPQTVLQTANSPQTVLQTAGSSAPQTVSQTAGLPQDGLQTPSALQSVLQTAGLPQVSLLTADIPQVDLQTASAPQTGFKTFNSPQTPSLDFKPPAHKKSRTEDPEQEQNNR